MRNQVNEKYYKEIAESLGLSVSEVRRAVLSFFGSILSEVKRLPLDNTRRIYTKSAFDDFTLVYNIPCIGRIGTSYSRYLTWRTNEAVSLPLDRRTNYRSRMTQGDIEHIADEILAGRSPEIKKKRNSELFYNVWLVGENGKRLARQVIKKEKDVQD